MIKKKKTNFIFLAFFFLFLRVHGDSRRWKIANKIKKKFKLAVEPEVWFRSWKYLCASCIKLKHCALATPPGSETEFEVIPPPACHVWIGPTLMTNYQLSERAPRAQWHQRRGILPHSGGQRTPWPSFSCLSLDLEGQCGGTRNEDTLNIPFLDVWKWQEAEKECTHLLVKKLCSILLTRILVRGVLVAVYSRTNHRPT